MEKKHSRPIKGLIQWFFALLVWGLFVFIILQLNTHINPGFSANLLLLIPTLLFSWSMGMWKGFVLTIFGLSLLVSLQVFQGFTSIQGIIVSDDLILFLVLVIASFIIGRIGEVSRKHRDQKSGQTQVIVEQDARLYFLSRLFEIILTSSEQKNTTDKLDYLVNQLAGLFSADECYFISWDEKKNDIKQLVKYCSSQEPDYSGLPGINASRMASHILDSGHSLLIDGHEDPPFLNHNSPLKTLLAIPLISKEKKLGVILFGFHSSRKFSDQELDWGELVSHQVSIACDTFLLMEKSADRFRELSGIHMIYQVLGYPIVSRNDFGQLTEALAKTMGVPICMLGLLENGTKELIVQPSAYGLEDEQIFQFRFFLENDGLELDFSNKEAYFTNSAASIPFSFSKISELFQVDSFMAVPLFQEGQNLFGFILFLNKLNGFTEEDLEMMAVYSDHASFVIQNLIMFSSEHRRIEELSILNELSNVTKNASNEDDLIEFMTQMIGEKLYPDNFGVLMLDKDQENLVLHSSYRMGKEEIKASQSIKLGIAGYVVRTGNSRRERDIRLVDDYLNKDDRTLSELCIPLKIGEKVFGVVNAESSRINAFSKQDEEILNIISSQMSSAIERLRSDEEQKKQTQVLARSNALIKALAQVSSKASKAVNPDGVMQTLGEELAALGLYCVIALPQADHRWIHIVYTSIPERVVKLIERASKKKLGEFSFTPDQFWEHPLGSSEPLFLQDPASVLSNYLQEIPKETVQRILAPTGVTSSMPVCQLPLVMEGIPQGYIWLWGEDLHPGDMPTMYIFGNQIAIALQNARLIEEVQIMAVTDELTEIFNRRHFFELAEREFNRAKRYESSISAIVIDIDHFKKINDTYGHIVGDQVLKNTAQVLKSNIRDQDTLGRIGGEEFSIILPLTELKEAHKLALRLRKVVSESKVETDSGPVGVNISLGVSELSNEMLTLLSLIHQADKAMYIAKSTGGNTVARI